MAMDVGVVLPKGSATTLGELIDGVFANRSAELDSGSAVFVASDANVLVVNWPNVGEGDNLIYIRMAARPTAPEQIAL